MIIKITGKAKCLALTCTFPRLKDCKLCPNYIDNAIREYEEICREEEESDLLPCCKDCRFNNTADICKNCVLGDMYEKVDKELLKLCTSCKHKDTRYCFDKICIGDWYENDKKANTSL